MSINLDLCSYLSPNRCRFIWVSLVIQNLCNRERLPIAEDLENEISKLPSGLESLYAIILNRITGSAANARRIAVTSIQWLSRARASLSCEEFAAAVAYTTRLEVTAQKILTVCGNLVVHDTTLDVFRFAHYTVSEYLESLDTQSEFSSVVAESIISSQCVQTCIQEILHMKPRRLDTSAKISYIQYACLYWPIHLYAVRTQMTDSSLNALRNFTKSTRSDTSQFKKWSSIVSKFPLRFLDAGIQRKVQMSFSKSHHPIFLAIAFELEALASDIAHSDNIIDENLINQVEMTPLVLACNIGNIPITKMLIERGADINANGELHSISSGDEPWPLNPMIATIYHRHWDVMRLLLSHGANLNFGFTDSATQYRFAPPLAMAVKSGAKDIVMELITAGADVNITTGMVTPIQLAAGLGHLEICQLLLDHNADPNLRCPYRHEHSISAFHIAAGAGHLSVVKVLRGVMGSGINIKHEMDSALAAAARDKRYEVTEWLLEQHADPNAATTVLGSTFLSAVQGGSVNIIKALLKHGADINHPGNRYGNALMIAADCSKDWSRSGYTPGYGGKGLGTYSLREEVFSLLLEHGADVEREVMYEFYREGRRTRRVITKDYIAREGSFIILQQLVRTVQKAGRDLDLDNLLFLAISSFQNREYIEKIRWLIEAGADVNAKLEDGTRPLHIAVQSGSLESVRLLLDHGANCHVMSNVLGSPLHAVYYRPIGNGSNSDPQAPDIDYRPQENWGKEDDIASFLLANNADIDAEGGLFGTALQAATQLFTSTHVRLLLNAGATDVHGVGYFGSALNAAAWMGNVDVVEILLEAGFDAEVQFLPYGTALHAAACYGRRPATLLLHHKREADPLWFDPRTPLDYTNFILNRHHHEFQKIFDLLLTRTTSVHTIVGIYGSVIQAAAYAGEIKRVEQLIDKGANVHEESIGFYGSVLQAACCGESRLWWDHFSLQQYPTDEDAVIFEEEEKYEELETDSHVAIVQLLLKKKVDVNVKGGYFGTPLQAAVHSDDPEIVRGLLNAGAVVTEDGEGFYGGCISGAISFGKYLMMETEAFEDNRHSGNIVEILGLLFDNISKEDFPRLIEKAVKRVRGKPNKDKLKEKRLEILKKAMKSWGKYEADIGEFFAEDEDSK